MQEQAELKEPAKTVINQEMRNIYHGRTALQLNEEFLAGHADSLEHRLAGEFMAVIIIIIIISHT